jgi:hypothetical protein
MLLEWTVPDSSKFGFEARRSLTARTLVLGRLARWLAPNSATSGTAEKGIDHFINA